MKLLSSTLAKPLIAHRYCNVTVLVVNGIIAWLTIVKVFPAILGIVIFQGCLAGAVWFSCFANGLLPKKARKYSFYSAPTEKVKRI